MEKEIELLLQVFASKDATLNETKEALLLLCNSSLQLKEKKGTDFEDFCTEHFERKGDETVFKSTKKIASLQNMIDTYKRCRNL